MSLTKIAILLASTLAVGIIILIGVLWITQVQTGEPVINRDIEIEYWGSTIPEEVMKPLIADYLKVKPNVKIVYSKKNFESYDLYRQTLVQRLRSKNGPVMFSANQSWMQFLTAQNTNLISENNDLTDKNEFKEKYHETYRSTCVGRGDKVVCVPLSYDGLVLLYNKDMFLQKGLLPPITWEDVRYTSQKLTQRDAKNQITVAGIGAGISNNVNNTPDVLALMFSQSKLKVPDDLDTEKSVNVAMYYVDLYRRDKVWDENMPEAINAFAVNKVGMVFAKQSDIEKIIEINPTLSFGVTQVPQLPEVQGTVTASNISGSWVETVSNSANLEQQNESWAFLAWMTMPEQQVKLLDLYKQYKGVELTSSLKELKDQGKSEYSKVLAKSASTASFSIFAHNTGNQDFSDIYKGLIDASTGNSSNRLYDVFKEAETQIKVVYQKRL